MMSINNDIAEAYAKGLLTEEDLSAQDKRQAAEAIVDVAILSQKGFLVSKETREFWIRKIMSNPKLTSRLFE